MENVRETLLNSKSLNSKKEKAWDLNEFLEKFEWDDEDFNSDCQPLLDKSTSECRTPRSFTVMSDTGEVVEESESNEVERFSAILRNYFSKASPAAIICDLKSRLDAWKDVKINVGIIGASGVGKSTLINNLRRLHPEDPGAAGVGAVQTTLEPTPYSYPKNPSLKLWDLPGVGTLEFPKSNYLSLINFEGYDFFIIVCASRFTENDYWFACQVQNAGKHFYLVRTKIDFDMRNEKEDHPRTYNQEIFFATIREDCIKSLKRETFGDLFVALVGKHADDFEMPQLEEKMIFDRKNFKREAVLFTLRASTQRVIEEKTAQLLRRVDEIAVAARAIAFLPVVSPLLSSRLIYSELKFYKETLGLDDERLNQISEHTKVPKEDLIQAIGQHFWLKLTFKSVLHQMSNFTHDSPCKRPFLKQLISVFSFVHSFQKTPRFLRTCIESMEPAAFVILIEFLPKE